ncbi:MAG: peptidyl-prolyl cis-trans isomerase, partial [Flavobacteriaceae bacterium]|nr:peptidyl-prolyl cis-trans isomerase [Flavobacteriaceae bacterium]
MIKKLIKEPLFHFIIGGIILLFIFELFGNEDTANNKTIQITKGQIDLMHTHWQRQLGRLPTETELQGLIDDHIREEILMQEALAMGLDKDDIIIRRRLAQKMEFVAGDMLTVKEPTSNEIKTYYESHKNELKESG